jgi:alcohol dehydrogenase class IV
MLGANSPVEAKRILTSILNEINLETRFYSHSISTDDAETLVENAINPQRMNNNPKLVSKKDIRSLIKKIISSTK